MSSNIVKWNYINFGKEDKCLINSDSRVELLADVLSVPRETAKAVIGVSSQDGFNPLEFPIINNNEEAIESEGFLPEPSDEELEASIQELLKQAEETLEKAKADAKDIVEFAKAEAESIKSSAYNVGKSDGFRAGMNDSQKHIITMEIDYKEKVRLLEEEYNTKLAEAELQFVEIVMNLIEKITGIVVEDKREVIFYLVHNGIRHLGRSERYTIHCSVEDYPFLMEQKEKICMAVADLDGVEFIENADFTRNQCVIEADSGIIDCSLDIQLKNLIESLKILNIR